MKLERECEALPHLAQSIALDRRYASDILLKNQISALRIACPQAISGRSR